jgi:hypothetical protein
MPVPKINQTNSMQISFRGCVSQLVRQSTQHFNTGKTPQNNASLTAHTATIHMLTILPAFAQLPAQLPILATQQIGNVWLCVPISH